MLRMIQKFRITHPKKEKRKNNFFGSESWKEEEPYPKDGMELRKRSVQESSVGVD